MIYDDLLKFPPYSISENEKHSLFKDALRETFDHHFNSCKPYRKFCEKAGLSAPLGDFDLTDLPYLPTDVFKKMRLSSVDESSVVRTLQSSGTSGSIPSTVVIDNVTRTRQVKTLMWLLSNFLGKERRPFVIIDVDPSTSSIQQQTITARTAAIRGFLPAASTASYCMSIDTDGNMSVDIPKLIKDLEKVESQGKRAVLFGYTYVLFSYAAKSLLDQGIRFSLSNASIVHIGGWKKLQDEAVNKQDFNNTLNQVFGVPEGQIIDAYGFTEQLGLIYMDCEDGVKRCPLVADIVIRDPATLEPVPDGEPGMIELITPLPHSYPGMAILLDDIGKVVSRESCKCGRHGTAFEVIGRATEAEIRGCGDVLAESLTGVV